MWWGNIFAEREGSLRDRLERRTGTPGNMYNTTVPWVIYSNKGEIGAILWWKG